MRRISVGDIMTRKLVTAEPSCSLYECAKLMSRGRVNSLFLINEDRLVGMLTARDILWVITRKPGLDLKKVKSIDFATRKIAVIKPSADISQALEKMKLTNFRRLPVITKGRLIGVVTMKDILAIEPQIYGEVRHLIDEIREE